MIHEMELQRVEGKAKIWRCPTCGIVIKQQPNKSPEVLAEPEGGMDHKIKHIGIRDPLKAYRKWMKDHGVE